MMDEKDAGFVLCNQLKRLYADLPVIIVSNVTPITGLDFRPRNAEEHSWVRADVMLNKPIVAERLRRASMSSPPRGSTCRTGPCDGRAEQSWRLQRHDMGTWRVPTRESGEQSSALPSARTWNPGVPTLPRWSAPSSRGHANRPPRAT